MCARWGWGEKSPHFLHSSELDFTSVTSPVGEGKDYDSEGSDDRSRHGYCLAQLTKDCLLHGWQKKRERLYVVSQTY